MSKAHTCTYFLSILGGKNCRGTCSRCWIWLHCQIYQQLPNQSRQEKPHYSSIMFQLIKELDNNPHRLPAKQAFCLSVILPRSHTYHQVFHNYANLDFFFVNMNYLYVHLDHFFVYMNFMQIIYFYAFSNFLCWKRTQRERGLYKETIIMDNFFCYLKKLCNNITLDFFPDVKFFFFLGSSDFYDRIIMNWYKTC